MTSLTIIAAYTICAFAIGWAIHCLAGEVLK
jgi:hypothetical protein